MPLLRHKIFVLVAFIISFNTLFAINTDTLACIDKVYTKNLKTVRLHQMGWEESYPALDLNSDNPLIFSFDQMDSEPIDFYYTIIHCSHDWKPSGLMFFEYADGFEENEIRDYEDSHSTMVPYTHFSLEIPNRDLQPTLTGNYLLIIYANEDKEEILCTKRFMVYENLIDAEGRVNPGIETDYRKKYQKLDFNLNIKNFSISNPLTDIKIVILQNYQWNNAVFGVQPSFLDNETLVYEWDDKTKFDAANEYRYFSFNNLEIFSEFVENIEFKKPYYYVTLYVDKPKFFDPYSSVEDVNGHYVISSKRFGGNNYPEVEAEYAIVDFSLEYTPVSNADIYIYGEMTNYELSDNYKLTYNLETKAYEILLFLKQGYYNYRYVLVNNEEENSMPDHSFIEGSYQETENNYLLLVYHRDPSDNYDKLINLTQFNSRNF